MIGNDEIVVVAQALDVNSPDVQRDYLFGWLLSGVYQGPLANQLVLKGGNALRKGYFANTRFSPDLDFATTGEIAVDALRTELTRITQDIHKETAVVFDFERLRVEPKNRVDKDIKVLEARVYFQDFFGKPGQMVISIRMDFTQYERLLFEPVERRLIHPYSDADRCAASIRCVRLEEILAGKLKCLLQRRHVADLYDYVHWLVFGNEQVDFSTVLTAFLKKTIYRRDPGAAFELLVGLPYQFLRGAWDKYVIAPTASRVGFEDALAKFVGHLRDLFGPHAKENNYANRRSLIFFPSRLRNVILEAGTRQTLLSIEYDGYKRLVEPYSIRYKTLKDGGEYEYFFAYDQTGGRSQRAGIKMFVPEKFKSAEVTDTKFEPRYEIEVSKSGDPSQRGAFGGRRYIPAFGITRRSASGGPIYVFRCTVCRRIFGHKTHDGTLRPHKNGRGSTCFGTCGTYVKTRW